MAADLTDDQIRALCEAATPGPWVSLWGHECMTHPDFDEEAIVVRAGALDRLVPAGTQQTPSVQMDDTIVGSLWYDGPHPTCRDADAAFIAAARDGWPRTLAQLDKARAEVERLRGLLDEALEGWDESSHYKGEYLRAKHEDAESIARIRAALP